MLHPAEDYLSVAAHCAASKKRNKKPRSRSPRKRRDHYHVTWERRTDPQTGEQRDHLLVNGADGGGFLVTEDVQPLTRITTTGEPQS